jgi:BASS family bile acid:Na+ symporter
MFEFYGPLEHTFARIQLVLFMTGMGATLAPADFSRIFRRPASLLLGLVGQLAIAPLLALLMARIAGLEAGIATGLVLVAALPGGNLSKVFTYIARGNVALSISLSATATVLCIATIPMVLHVMTARTLPPDVDLPADVVIIQELLLFLLAPLVTGMVLARLAPRARRVVSMVLIRAGLVVAAGMVLCSIFAGRVQPGQHGLSVSVTIVLFCLLSQQLSMLPFRLLRWPNPDCVAVGIETTMRNINLALALKALLFPARPNVADPIGDGVFFVSIFYAGAAFFVAIPLAWRLRRVIRREQARNATVSTVLPHTAAKELPSPVEG